VVVPLAPHGPCYEFDAALVYHGSSVTEGARGVLDRYVNFPGRPSEPVK